MKTTLDISDAILERAKARAAREGQTLRSVVEEALRQHLDSLEAERSSRRTLKIRPWGKGGLLPEYEQKSWNEILDEVNTRPLPDDRG
jgi:hypothetical protein